MTLSFEVQTLHDALTSSEPFQALSKLAIDGTLETVFPEIYSIVVLGDMNGKHKDVWNHTLQVVSNVPNLLELRLAALLHDIGKSRTRKLWSNGKVTFHGHEVVSASMTLKLDKRVNLFGGNELLNREVHLLVENHLRPAQYSATWTDSAIRRLITELGTIGVERLLCLSRADLSTKNQNKIERAKKNANALEERIRNVIALDNAPKLAKGTMNIVIDKVKLKPGPWLKAAQNDAEKAMISGLLTREANAEECADYILKHILKLV